MDALASAHSTLEKRSNLSKTLTSVQALIDQLQTTRDAIAAYPDQSALHLAKAKMPTKQAFDRMEDDLKDVNKGLNQYQKALKDKFKTVELPGSGSDLLQNEEDLVERAVAMHLLREGMFDVASMFVKEVRAYDSGEAQKDREDIGIEPKPPQRTWLREFADPESMQDDQDMEDEDNDEVAEGSDADGHRRAGFMQRRFSEMYHILDALRNHHDLSPAISWTQEHSEELERRGSNLEFELARLKFLELLHGTSSPSDAMETTSPSSDIPATGTVAAINYARATFPSFPTRYTREITHLLGTLAFPSMESPTAPVSHATVAEAFTSEYCSLLSLSSTSPLYLATTAGAIALPVLEKVERVMKSTRGQWTSENELPVETPLPPGFVFHNVFVCPVSKEQATDANPPMMMPCGHVIARESLEMHARGKSRMKCPYCPSESHPRESKRIYI